MSNTKTKSSLLERGEAVQASDNARSWGTFSAVGTAYNEIVANFNPSGSQKVVTVVVPENLKEFALIALENKLTVLASFNGPLNAYASLTDLAIYN